MMTIKYRILTVLFVCVALASCVDDDLLVGADNNDMAMFTDGYSLNLTVTLDNMGGTRADETAPAEKDFFELENYIDPEKFRVLFFDREDRFLFESKSRWVKKLTSNESSSHSQWLVSVPLYDYGNDEKEHWNWDEIIRVLTGDDLYDKEEGEYIYTKDMTETGDEEGNKIPTARGADGKLLPAFKIAILANRPAKEWNMGINGRDAQGNDFNHGSDYAPIYEVLAESGWTIKNGPDWHNEQTRWGTDRKEVFDLHHCQEDPIYQGKQWYDRGLSDEEYKKIDSPAGYRYFGPTERNENGYLTGHWYKNYGIYNFISSPTGSDEGLLGGATSTWVDWGNGDTGNKWTIDGDGKTLRKTKIANGKEESGYRKFSPPSQEHPIPMYGIQEFKPIENWTKGTPFNLSFIADGQEKDEYEFKQISLLRSVVKLELVMPFEPDWVLMFYPNIYARCEPMDVWTPTDQIWNDQPHDDDAENCEWYNIRKYGPISRATDPYGPEYTSAPSEDEAVRVYQQRLSWFYGAWKDKKWGFEGYKGTSIGADAPDNLNNEEFYPRIFNSCIQRNGAVFCDSKYIDSEGKVHYLVYTGERNINDPTGLVKIGDDSSGAPTITYWMVSTNGNVYSIALADYKDNQNFDFKSYAIKSFTVMNNIPKHNQSGLGESTRISKKDDDDGKVLEKKDIQSYEQAVQAGKAAMPWPLVRNHVYRINIDYAPEAKPIQPMTESRTWDFTQLLGNQTKINLNHDANWEYSNSKPTVTYLSWNSTPNQSSLTTDDMTNTGTSNNVATWGSYSLMIMRSDKAYSGDGAKIDIDGEKYQTIKLSNGAQNVLTLPAGKVSKKFTLYSYINKTTEQSKQNDYRTCYWTEINGVKYEEENAKILQCFSDGDLTNPDKCEYTFEEPRNVITFTNKGEQLFFVVVVEVEDEIPYWQSSNPNGILTANGEVIEELQDLKFEGASAINIYDDTEANKSSKIRITGDATITFPKMPSGTKISITGQSANHDKADRGIKPIQNLTFKEGTEGAQAGSEGECMFVGKRVEGAKNEGVYTFVWEVETTEIDPVDVQFKLINGGSGGIDFYEFRAEVPSNSTRFARANQSGQDLRMETEMLYSKSLNFESAE